MTSGALFTTDQLDSEKKDTYLLDVYVVEDGVQSIYTSVTVNVDDVNDNAPTLSQERYDGTVIEDNVFEIGRQRVQFVSMDS